MSGLPKGWQQVVVADVFPNISNGKNVRQDKSSKGLPITRIETIASGTVAPERFGYANLFKDGNEKWLLHPGDILLSHINSPAHVGRVAMYDGHPNEVVHGMNLLRLQPDLERVDPRFALYYFRTPQFIARLRRYVNQAVNQASVSVRNFSGIHFPLPPLNEQRRIAAILDHAIRVENLRHSQLSSLKSLSMAAYHEIFDLGSLTPEPIGHHIAEHQLGLDRRAAEQGPQRAHSYLKMDSITSSGGLDLNKATRVDATKGELAKFNVGDGDMLLNTRNTRELVGKTAIYRGAPRLYNNNLMRIRFNETLRPDYVHHFLWTAQGIRQLEFRKSGTTSVFAVYAKDLMTLRIPIPPMRDQIEFENLVNKCNEKHSNLSLNGQDHDRLKYSLQSRAFRGEL